MPNPKLFTDRHGQAKVRTKEVLDEESRMAIWNLLSARIEEEWFGYHFNATCRDGYVFAGTDFDRLEEAMTGLKVLYPPYQLRAIEPASDGEVFDAVEYAYQFVAEPRNPSFHSFMSHTHWSYDQERGRSKFQDDINQLFARQGLAFELKAGEVTRIAQ